MCSGSEIKTARCTGDCISEFWIEFEEINQKHVFIIELMENGLVGVPGPAVSLRA